MVGNKLGNLKPHRPASKHRIDTPTEGWQGRREWGLAPFLGA